jgi:uncharacterized protein YbcC (UPF0753/DUF2309 family)
MRPPTPAERFPEASIEALRRAVEHARHLLPAQGPIEVFIHHNTLHAFQHLPFDEALERAHEVLGAEVYLPERVYRAHLASGRILPSDLDAALLDRWERLDATPVQREVEQLGLHHGIPEHDAAYVRWVLAEIGPSLRDDLPASSRARILSETRAWISRAPDDDRLVQAAARTLRVADPGALRALHRRDEESVVAALLWSACVGHRFPPRPTLADITAARVGSDRTLRDLLLAVTGDDPAALVDPVIIRFVAAALDQGQAHLAMPGRERGLWRAFVDLHAHSLLPRPAWLRDLPSDLARLRDRSVEEVCLLLLRERGIEDGALPWIVERVLLELPGWAGMVAYLERRAGPDAVHGGAPRLLEYLAVRLLLMRYAMREVAARTLGYHGTLIGLREAIRASVRRDASSEERAGDDALVGAYRLFHLAQLAGRSAEEVARSPDDVIAEVLRCLDNFDELTRRRLLHDAYERHHRDEVMAGLAANLERPLSRRSPRSPVRLQALFCIDDREEGFRRHLEEVEPNCETFGVAGFFGFAIDYRGIDDGVHAPLCPVVVTPQHRVTEVPQPEDAPVAMARSSWRRRWWRLWHAVGAATRTLGLGVALVPMLGVGALATLAVRILAPRASARLARRLGRAALPAPRTALALVRDADDLAELDSEPCGAVGDGAGERGTGAGCVPRDGFDPEELADRVAGQLQNIGLVEGFAPLVLVLGHGSTSVNNPHQSAYDCGACGGRHGAANARAFAEAANRDDVRSRLRDRGIVIPASTWFVGGLHDTATDAVRLDDIDRVPPSHAEALREAVALLDRARGLHAQERCRRFASAPRRPTPERALAHVEARAADLGEPRPELGHVTNAVCVVGRRALTRGLFLDRRAFLVSYDPARDPEGEVLERVLAAVVPVCAGINLEYFFSCVDNARLGAGTKLPHNVVGLLGVMDGAGGDLRTGLPRQMIEIHEPVRLLMVVEAPPEAVARVCERQPVVRELVHGGWVRTVSVTVDEATGARACHVLERGVFSPYAPPRQRVPLVRRSFDRHGGEDGFFGPAIVDAEAVVVGHAGAEAPRGVDGRRREGRRAA